MARSYAGAFEVPPRAGSGMKRYIRTAARWPRTFGIAAGLWLLLAALAGWVKTGSSLSFDTRLLSAMRVAETGAPRGPSWMPSAARDITALGSAAVLVPLGLVVCTWFLVRRERASAMAMAAAGFGSYAISTALKELFGRVRPDVVAHLVEVISPSFPSGHATASCATYLAIALLAAGPEAPTVERRFLVITGLAAAFIVGFSRVYLGVHYPTDVLAGWMAGAGWGLVCVSVARGPVPRTADAAARR